MRLSDIEVIDTYTNYLRLHRNYSPEQIQQVRTQMLEQLRQEHIRQEQNWWENLLGIPENEALTPYLLVAKDSTIQFISTSAPIEIIMGLSFIFV
jgi:hypothetical protein